MPTYDYECSNRDCGHEFETTQKITAPKLTRCPECQNETLIRLISPCGFKKGAGAWEENNYEKGAG